MSQKLVQVSITTVSNTLLVLKLSCQGPRGFIRYGQHCRDLGMPAVTIVLFLTGNLSACSYFLLKTIQIHKPFETIMFMNTKT